MERFTALSLRAAAGVAAVVVGALPTPADVAAASTPAPLQPVRLERLPLPPGLIGMKHPTWLHDGKHIVTSFTTEGEAGSDMAVMNRRGRGFRCLTCGLEQVLGADRPFNTGQPFKPEKSHPFPDGRRVLLAFPIRPDRVGGLGLPGPDRTAPDFNYGVLECTPSILDCRDRELLPLELPGGGLSRGVQNREGRLSPDGKWLAWTQVSLEGTAMTLARLVPGSTAYTVDDPRVLTPPRPPDGSLDPAVWNAAASLYELKSFTPDGQHVLYSAFRSAENFDDFELDLRTGESRRLTNEPEWDEDVAKSPGGDHLALYASRGFDRMTPFAQFKRPTYVDFPTFAAVGRYMLKQQQGGGAGTCLLAPWLLSSVGQRGTYFGQPLDIGTKRFYPGPTSQWRPQGDAVLFHEYRIGDHSGGPEFRPVIAWLDRMPEQRLRQRPPATPEPTWAPLRDDWQGYQNQQRTAVIPGQGGGTATVRLLGGVNFQLQSVTYDGYSSDGKTFIDGTERIDSPFTILYSRWQADLHASGRHTGRLKSDLTLSAGQGGGSLESVWDERRYEGLPSATTCQSNRLPKLVPRVVSARTRRNRVVVDVRALARVPLDLTPRPVHGARVKIGEAAARSNRHGRVRLEISPGSARAVRASADGFIAGSAKLGSIERRWRSPTR